MNTLTKIEFEIEIFRCQLNLLKNFVLRLKKGLYGLKQSGGLWHQKFSKILKLLGFW